MPQYQGKLTLVSRPITAAATPRSNGEITAKRRPAPSSFGSAFWVPTRRRWAMLANVPPVTQSQIAATLAAFLGHDYCAVCC